MLTDDYVLGLVDGEGSFTAYIKDPFSNKQGERRTRAELHFYLKLQEKDKVILLELKKFFDCGSIYLQRDRRANHQDCYRYEVSNRKDINSIIIPFFKEHKLKTVSKQKDFAIFVQIASRINRGNHLTQQGLEELYILKQKMH